MNEFFVPFVCLYQHSIHLSVCRSAFLSGALFYNHSTDMDFGCSYQLTTRNEILSTSYIEFKYSYFGNSLLSLCSPKFFKTNNTHGIIPNLNGLWAFRSIFRQTVFRRASHLLRFVFGKWFPSVDVEILGFRGIR